MPRSAPRTSPPSEEQLTIAPLPCLRIANYEDILDYCCFDWNKLVERPWLIMSIGTRRWAHGSDF
jgi:hypothetical protein